MSQKDALLLHLRVYVQSGYSLPFYISIIHQLQQLPLEQNSMELNIVYFAFYCLFAIIALLVFSFFQSERRRLWPILISEALLIMSIIWIDVIKLFQYDYILADKVALCTISSVLGYISGLLGLVCQLECILMT